jgi:hypothetical protein
LTLTKDGRLARPIELERLAAAAANATDCFLFCHGWLYDEAEARRDSARFFGLLDSVLSSVPDRVVPVHVGLHWPSKPFADRDPTSGVVDQTLWPELERRVRTHRRDDQHITGLLLDLCRAEIPASSEEEAELDLLRRRLNVSERPKGSRIMPFFALSFWTMKRRAGDIGERLGRESLASLWRTLSHPIRLHLVGHSFGAKLVTSAVLGGAPAYSLTLLLGAFSAFAFAPNVPRYRRPGFYCRLLAERRVERPIVVLRSDHDTALATFYRTQSGTEEIGRNGADELEQKALTEPVATSALGAVGARGIGAPELDLIDVQQTGNPSYPIDNVEGSRVVKTSTALLGAHRDIFHREIAMLVAMASGLIVGGPDGARPRPLDPCRDS